MVPEAQMVAIPVEAGREEVLEVLADHRHTRYPVYEGSTDNIIGVLDAKDLLLDGSRGSSGARGMHPPVVLPESVPAVQVSAEAQRARAQLVVLADEYGGTAGIVSVFDMVEYLAASSRMSTRPTRQGRAQPSTARSPGRTDAPGRDRGGAGHHPAGDGGGDRGRAGRHPAGPYPLHW